MTTAKIITMPMAEQQMLIICSRASNGTNHHMEKEGAEIDIQVLDSQVHPVGGSTHPKTSQEALVDPAGP